MATVLELGSGGGNNASHMKAYFTLTLTDKSRAMLDISHKLNPECEHIQGDMRNIRIKRLFDSVFVHDAVSYMTTFSDLCMAVETAFIHCKPGGAVLFAPDYLCETFRTSTQHGGHDAGDRGLRYLEWTWDPDQTDTSYFVDFAYLLKERENIRCESERHVLGLFSEAEWRQVLDKAGFVDVTTVPYPGIVDKTEDTPVIVGIRPD